MAVQQNGSAVESNEAELREILRKLKTRITIIGVGGGGSNTAERIWEAGVSDAEVYAANTDSQHLLTLSIPHKILLGRRTTRGLGAGDLPKVGEEAAKEAEEEIRRALEGADMVFITAGMGGGTGTGAAPLIAQLAKDMGVLTVAICSFPFSAEGKIRAENARWGLERLGEVADTVIVIPNDRLLDIAPRLSLKNAFKVADELLMRAVKGITEMVTRPGLVNLDFNDLKTVMKGGGVAMIGMGESSAPVGERIFEALEEAINSPLLDVDISTADGVLVNVTGGPDMSVSEAESMAEEILSRVSSRANLIWGAAIDPGLEKTIRVMVVMTGVRSEQITGRVARPSTGEMEVDMVR